MKQSTVVRKRASPLAPSFIDLAILTIHHFISSKMRFGSFLILISRPVHSSITEANRSIMP